MTDRALLLVDAIANLVLGALLLGFPLGLGESLGLPKAATGFYPSILGAVIFGIGISLLFARAGRPGLGIDGAIAINLIGAGVLVVWLLTQPLDIPTRGVVTLWIVAGVVLAIGLVEFYHRRGVSIANHTTVIRRTTMTRDIIATEKAPGAVGPYSQAVRTDQLVFTAGQIPIDPATGKLIEGPIEDPTRRVLENVRAVLEAAGTRMDKVVKMTVFMTDFNDVQRMNSVYAEFFPEAPPARSAIQVAALPLGAPVEIEAVALVGDS